MDKRIVLITIAGLIMANLSCTNKKSIQQEKQPIEADSMAADSIIPNRSLGPVRS